MTPRVRYSSAAGIGHILLNRPEKRNALDGPMVEQLIEALETFQHDEAARVGIISGAGPVFCAGGDLNTFPEMDTDRGLRSVRDDGERVYKFFSRTRKPVIACVHGACIGGGFEIALGAHFIYAAKETVFGLEEIRLGLIPGWGGTVRLPRAIPARMATELLLTGRRIDAQEAHRLGLVNRIDQDSEVCMAAARETAACIAGMPQRAVEFAMDVLRASRDESEWAFSLEQTAVAILFGTPEAHHRFDDTLARRTGTGPAGP